MRRSRRFFGGLAVVVAVVGISVPAGAHAQLLKSDPAPFANVPNAPKQVRLEFSEAVTASSGSLRVFTATGSRVDVGIVKQPSPSVVSVDLRDIARGGYLVSWRIISADGHPAQGAYTFQVKSGAPVTAERARALSNRTDDLTISNLATGVARALSVVTIVLLGAWMLLRFLGGQQRSTSQLLLASCVGALLAGIAQICGMAAAITGRGAAGLLDTGALRSALGTSTGTAAAIRAGIPLLLVAALRFRSNRFPPSWMRAGLAIAAMAVASAHIGHAQAGRYSTLALASVTFHWGIVALWCGGLLALRMHWPTWNDDQRAHATGMLSPIFLTCVAVIVGTGAFQVWRLMPNLEEIGTSRFGNLIAAKVVMLAVIVVIAAGNRGMLKDLQVSLADLDGNADAESVIERSSRSVRRGITAELVIASVIFGATVVLAGTPPPAEGVAAQGTSLHAETSDGKYQVDLDIAPLRVGPNEIHITAATPTGVAPPARSISVVLEQPSRDIRGLEQRLFILGPGHVKSIGTDLAFPDTWNAVVTVRTDEFTESTAVLQFDVP